MINLALFYIFLVVNKCHDNTKINCGVWTYTGSFKYSTDKVWPHAVDKEYPDAALKAVKTSSKERCTLLTLNGHHLCYVAEAARPPMYFQLVENGGGEAAAAVAIETFNTELYRCNLSLCCFFFSTTMVYSDCEKTSRHISLGDNRWL